MAKDSTFYFSHDYNARSDSKIKRLLSKHGMAGYGIFWSIIEDLYNNANALPTDYESIAFDMRTAENVIKSVVEDFSLFEINGTIFSSLSVKRRLEERDAKSLKAKASAEARWGNKDANALPTQSDSNAIKERKGKENKGNSNLPSNEGIFESEKKLYNALPEKTISSLIAFIKEKKPKLVTPYGDLWNLFAEKHGCGKVLGITKKRKDKLRVRLGESQFDFIAILTAAAKQKYALESKWFTFDFIVENDNNYVKVLEMKYTDSASEQKAEPVRTIPVVKYEN